jgi:hypothetical protein
MSKLNMIHISGIEDSNKIKENHCFEEVKLYQIRLCWSFGL